MTTREAMAAAALTGLLASNGQYSRDEITALAVDLADAIVDRLECPDCEAAASPAITAAQAVAIRQAASAATPETALAVLRAAGLVAPETKEESCPF